MGRPNLEELIIKRYEKWKKKPTESRKAFIRKLLRIRREIMNMRIGSRWDRGIDA